MNILDIDDNFNKPGNQKCDCCGAMVDRVCGTAWTKGYALCFECVCEWYDGGRTDPVEIKLAVEASRAKRALEKYEGKKT